MAETSNHRWRFIRAGGFDQVRLDTGADLVRLRLLDPKLWVALSCPVKGLEFDARTLELLDADGDGHVRMPELVAAVEWVGGLLSDPEWLVRGRDGIPLSAIAGTGDEARRMRDAGRSILVRLGRGEDDLLTVGDTSAATKILSEATLNGDGIVPPETVEDPEDRAVLEDVMKTLGEDADRSGKPGVSHAKFTQFLAEARALRDWLAQPAAIPDLSPLGDGTAAAVDAYLAVRAKVDDHFTRCRLAAFDASAAAALNPSADAYVAVAARALSASDEAMAALPIAIVAPGKPLPLVDAVNPAWVDAMARLRDATVAPLLGARRVLTEAEWATIGAKLVPCIAWRDAKPATKVEPLGSERLAAILDGGSEARIEAMFAADEALAPQFEALTSLERLVRYCRDLHTFANSFVSFREFYGRTGRATFQVGTLYIDCRSCDLCVRVSDAAAHATLANLSRICLLYCECTRPGEKMTIAAAMTAGDSDHLMVGRNGVFVDRQGRDWDARVVRILEHPISIRQAFWSPYKKLGRTISEQAEKFAASRSKASEDKLVTQTLDVGKKKEGEKDKPAVPAAFDVAKFAGIFAAIGLAIGAIGSALAAVLGGILSLKWWQIPLVLVAVVLGVSGFSMLLAWLKLRTRNLGPALDGNGWAVNARARINIPFGTSLTQRAAFPPGADRSLVDPYQKPPSKLRLPILIGVLLVLVAIALWQFDVVTLPF